MTANQIVISTRQVLKENEPILLVTHDNDGIWQCLDGRGVLKEDDAVVVSLNEIIEVDPTLLEIIHIPLGSKALRKSVGSEWVVTNDN